MADIPFGKFRDKGLPVDNISNYSSSTEDILSIASQSELNLYRLLFVTRQGMCKIVSGGEFDVTKRTVAATKLGEEDELIGIALVTEHQHLILQSKDGYFLRFDTNEIAALKKTAIGVRGMRLGAGDVIENVYYCQPGSDDSIVYKDKQVPISKIKLNKRDTKGTKIRV